jgi:exosome complex component RRP42
MEISNINKEYIENLLKEGKRSDNRELLDYRDLIIETNVSKKAEGSARVKLGKTDVIVGVKLSTQEPYPDHDDEGTMMVSMEFSPAAGQRYEGGPPKMDSIEISRVIDRGIRESGFIDWKKLCIEKGEKVWSISVDIYCINDDGNALDAGSIGAVTALQLAKFPNYDKKNDEIDYDGLSKDSLPLTENVPLSMTLHKIGDNVFVDPNRDEEDASEARVTIAISKPNKDAIIHSMQKGNMSSIDSDNLVKIVETSEKVYDATYPEIAKQIRKLQK